jgi:hypothetical protein
MITRLFLIFSMCCGLVSLNSDATAQSKKRFGVKGGISFATQDSEIYDLFSGLGVDKSAILGVVGGVFVEFQRQQDVTIQVEALYVRKGVNLNSRNLSEIQGLLVRLDYLEIPILLEYNLGRGFIKPSVYAGLAVGFLLNSSVVDEEPENPISDSEDPVPPPSDANEFNTADIGITFGSAVDFGQVGIDLRLDFGVLNIGNEILGGGRGSSIGLTNLAFLGFLTYTF